MDVASAVRDFVIENFLYGDSGTLDDEASFLESGVIDSTGVLELVAFLEKTCGITIEDDEIVPENLDSLARITRFLQRKGTPCRIAD